MSEIPGWVICESQRIAHPLMEYYRYVYGNSPRLDGTQNIEGKRVLVYMEQGYGDCIQFLRYLPDLRHSQKCIVTVVAPPELKRLIENCASGWDYFHPKDDPNLPEHDYHVLSLSLPFIIKEHLLCRGQTHGIVPYLLVKENKDVEEIDGYKMGICWEGSPNLATNFYRSVPLLYFRKLQQQWKGKKPLRLFSLQKEMHQMELLQHCEDLELLGVEIEDFYDTAQLIKSLDCVVTVDTSVLHLAGAMNKKTFLLLVGEGDGRFKHDATQWYPSVSILRREPENATLSWEGWDAAFEHLQTIG